MIMHYSQVYYVPRHKSNKLVIGYMGYGPDIYALLWNHKIEDTDDDQLYYTLLYLDESLRV